MGTPRDTPDGKSGYPEKQPRDRADAHRPDPKKPPNPDEGGLEREPDEDGTNEGG